MINKTNSFGKIHNSVQLTQPKQLIKQLPWFNPSYDTQPANNTGSCAARKLTHNDFINNYMLSETVNKTATLALTSACSFTRISRQTAPCVEAAAQCSGVCNVNQTHDTLV